MQIVTPKCPEIFPSGAMCRFCYAKLSNIDVKYNNLSFGDPNWVIPIGEETLEPYLQIREEINFQFMELRSHKSRITVGDSVS